MPNPSLLSRSLTLLLLFHGCLARSSQSWQFQSECQINRLDTIEPVTRIKSEAGVTEWWNPKNKQLKCAGMAVMRHIVEPDGLVLPSVTNAPQLLYAVQDKYKAYSMGSGIQGTVMPGCPETFQDSQQSQHGQSLSFQDQHQKIRRFREGDVLALAAGVVHWSYNGVNQSVITVNLFDTGNSANQLDMNPRVTIYVYLFLQQIINLQSKFFLTLSSCWVSSVCYRFHLAGKPEEDQKKLRQLQQQQQQQGSSSEEEEEDEDNRKSCHHQQQSSYRKSLSFLLKLSTST
ncbi:hypothetical protein QUC31_004538 [Theobroma cacao]